MRPTILTLMLALLALLAACSGTPAAPTSTVLPPTETIPFIIVTGGGERSTLPPTWTPTSTYSPIPPSYTPSPTLTFTPTATYTAAEVCDHFTVATKPRAGRPYLTGSSVPFLYLAEFTDALVHISIINRETGDEQGGQYPAAVTPGGSFQIDEPGTYDWTIGVIMAPYDELCQQSGSFIVVAPPEGSGSPTEGEATEEATAEATAESISDCPNFIVDPQFEEGQSFSASDIVSIALDSDDSAPFMRVVVTYRETSETHTLQIPSGAPFTLDLPVQLLFGAGTYDWSASLYGEAQGETCVTSGTFVVRDSLAAGTPIVFTPSPATATSAVTPRSTPTAAPPTASSTATRRASATPRPATAAPTSTP
ncbi:MAG: hypothetical protein U0694_11285 [Anaerolineae bacterium]